MLLASNIPLRLAGNLTAGRRRREFIPSISASASRLEDRALLSAAGGSAHAAVAAHNLADTPTGQHVTAMFESILHTAPTQQQVTRWVQRIRAGTSIKVLQRQLTAEARMQASMPATAANPIVITVPSSSSSFPRRVTLTVTLPAGLTSSVVGVVNGSLAGKSGVRQVPPGATLTVTFTGGTSFFPFPTVTVTRPIRIVGRPTSTGTTGSRPSPPVNPSPSPLPISPLPIGSLPIGPLR
jgi:hypothetical protein